MTSQLQRGIALSLSVAEYLVHSGAAKVVSCICQVLNKLKIEQSSTLICQDNNGWIEWAEVERTRHISRRIHIVIRHHLVIEMIDKGNIHIERSGTDNMLSYMFRKPLTPSDFQSALRTLNIFKFDEGISVQNRHNQTRKTIG